jgi:hypothetical protein
MKRTELISIGLCICFILIGMGGCECLSEMGRAATIRAEHEVCRCKK